MTSLRAQDSKSARWIAARVSLVAVLTGIWCASAPEAAGSGLSPHVGYLPAAFSTAATVAAPCSGRLQPASSRPHAPWPSARLWAVADCATEANRIPTALQATGTPSAVSVNWTAPSTPGVIQYRLERSVNQGPFLEIAQPTGISYTDNAVTTTPVTTYVYRVRAEYSGGVFSAPSNIDVATAMTFTNDPLSTGVVVDDQHVVQLRQAIEAVCRTAGETTSTWLTDPTITPQVTTIKKAHLEELRAKASECLTAVGVTASPYTTDVTISAGVTMVKKEHLQELRNAVH